LASEHFDVFVTVDRNLAFQQPIVSLPIAVIVLRCRTNRLWDIEPLVPALMDAIEVAMPGAVQFVGP
jgi:hypothetical protein